MADVADYEELIATRKLHGLDDGLFEEEKDQKKMNRENDEIEYEKNDNRHTKKDKSSFGSIYSRRRLSTCDEYTYI